MLKFFKTMPEVHAYVWRELVESLHDDLLRMCKEEHQHYDDVDRAEMRKKIMDIVNVCPVELPKFADLLCFEYDRSARDDGQSGDVHTACIAGTGGGTDVEWYVWGEGSDDVTELDEASVEHIRSYVIQGYREGELAIAIPGIDDEVCCGYWRIKV